MAEKPREKKTKPPSVRKEEAPQHISSETHTQPGSEAVPEEIRNALARVVDEPTLGKILSSHDFVHVFVTRYYHWQGTLPPPEILERYAAMLSDAPERIFALAERQSAHRHTIEGEVIESDKIARTRGQRYALVIALGGLLLSGYALHLACPSYALAIVFVTLGSMVVTFLKSGSRQHQTARHPKTPPQSTTQVKTETDQGSL